MSGLWLAQSSVQLSPAFPDGIVPEASSLLPKGNNPVAGPAFLSGTTPSVNQCSAASVPAQPHPQITAFGCLTAPPDTS